MFTPLHYQSTEADCYPTSVLNALVWLFERRELPGATLQRIYGFCLDGIERGLPGSYTSEHAGLAVVDWLDEFKTASFAVAAEAVRGPDLHLRRAGRVLRWLQHGGVAVLDVRITTAMTHSILALWADSGYVDCWDPCIRGAGYDYGRGASRLETDGRSPNLRLPTNWLDSARNRRYSLGPLAERSGVLIRRTRHKRRGSHTAS